MTAVVWSSLAVTACLQVDWLVSGFLLFNPATRNAGSFQAVDTHGQKSAGLSGGLWSYRPAGPLAPLPATHVHELEFTHEDAEDPDAVLEAERIMKQLEAGAERDDAVPDTALKYQPSLSPADPIVTALRTVLKCQDVLGFELLDSRWNGNEALRYDTDRGNYFVKMNRVEDISVFMTEAVSLSALAKADVIKVPKPLHLGKLPKVGDIGPGAFMVLEYLPLVPFGPMRSANQQLLGQQLAELHLNQVHTPLHKGRFGFPVSNFLALTPLNNTWADSWPDFFQRRLSDQVQALYKDKPYGRAALAQEDQELGHRLRALVGKVPELFQSFEDEVTPALLHGDLWIGNAGATKEGPCVFDPASFFGHSEFELAIMDMFGGFTDTFWSAYHEKLPRQAGFVERQQLYKLYHYLNQLNLFGDPKVRQTIEALLTEVG